MHHRRRRPRSASGRGRGSRGYWLHHWPRWWDLLFHTRPSRRRARRVEQALLAGRVDPDEATLTPNHKPHIYYW